MLTAAATRLSRIERGFQGAGLASWRWQRKDPRITRAPAAAAARNATTYAKHALGDPGGATTAKIYADVLDAQPGSPSSPQSPGRPTLA